MQKEDLNLLKTLKGVAAYYSHTPDDQARIAKISHATWYRRLKNPGSFTLSEFRRLIFHYKIGLSEICDILGVRRS